MPSGRSALIPSLATSLAALSLSLTLTQPAQSAGLGRLSVLSGLGQPLRAEVDVTSVSREEAASMTARLAPAEAFRLAGVDYGPVLSTLRFSIANRPDGRRIVRITSVQPIDEPVVDLLVELNWAGGRLVRKYTFLLDPPEVKLEQRAIARGNEAVDTVAPVAVEGDTRAAAPPRATGPAGPDSRAGGQRSAPPRTAPAAVAPGPARTTAASQAAPSSTDPAVAAGTVVVREGETIATVANRTRPAAIHIDQAIIALYRANPAAFFGSIHLLKAGATLTVPDEQTMASVDRIAARNEIRGIRGSRETARAVDDPGAVAASAPAALAAESARAGGRPSATPPSTTPPASSPAAPSSAELLRVAQARITELERTVDALRKEVDEADQRIAELQKQLPGSAASPTASSSGPAAAPASSPAIPAASSAPTPRSAPAAPVSPSPMSAPAAASSSPSPASVPAATPSSPSPASVPAASSSPPPASVPAAGSSSSSPTAAPAGTAPSSPSQAPTAAATPAVPLPGSPGPAPSATAPSAPVASAPAPSAAPSAADTPASAPAAPQAAPDGGITTLVDDLLAEPAVPVAGAALLAALLAGPAFRARQRRKAAPSPAAPARARGGTG